jgi:hypothetical protein
MELNDILKATAAYLATTSPSTVKSSASIGVNIHQEVENSGVRLSQISHETQTFSVRNAFKPRYAGQWSDKSIPTEKIENTEPRHETWQPLAYAPPDAVFVEKTYNRTGTPEGKIAYQIDRANNVFIRAAVMAYAEHLPFRIKPDHILELMVSGFNYWLNDFGGAALLAYPSTEIKICAKDWHEAIDQLSAHMCEKIPEALRPILLHKFSTTTPDMHRAHTLTVAAAYRKFVVVRFHMLCGISDIFLDGTEADWRSLKAIANAILAVSQGQLTPWIDALQSALDLMIASFTQVTPEMKEQWLYFINKGGACAEYATTGWINAFFPYVYNRKYTDGQETFPFVQNPAVWQGNWKKMTTQMKSYIKSTGQRNPDYHQTEYCNFPSSLMRQQYPVIIHGQRDVKISVTAGLIAVLQWPDGALEPFLSYQVDRVIE